MKGTDLALSPKTREVLDWLDARRRETAQMFDSAAASEYTGFSRVELDNLESRGGPSSVLNPLEAGRSASSGLRR